MSQPDPISMPPLGKAHWFKSAMADEGPAPPARVAKPKPVPVTPGSGMKPVSRLRLSVPGGHALQPPEAGARVLRADV